MEHEPGLASPVVRTCVPAVLSAQGKCDDCCAGLIGETGCQPFVITGVHRAPSHSPQRVPHAVASWGY